MTTRMAAEIMMMISTALNPIHFPTMTNSSLRHQLTVLQIHSQKNYTSTLQYPPADSTSGLGYAI